jgi:hypothetical protein
MITFLLIIKAQPNENNLIYLNINLRTVESVAVHKEDDEKYTKIKLFTLGDESHYPVNVVESPEQVIDCLRQEFPILHEYSERAAQEQRALTLADL